MIDHARIIRELRKKLWSLPLWQRRLLVFGAAGLCLVLVVGLIISLSTGLPHQLVLESTAFSAGQDLPAKYTCDGENINPPFSFSKTPEGTKSLALLMEDASVTNGTALPTHWLVFNIPADSPTVMEGIRPAGTVTRSYLGNFGYSGPCPDPGVSHEYVIHLYALNTELLSINSGATAREFSQEIKGKVLDEASISTRYERRKP